MAERTFIFDYFAHRRFSCFLFPILYVFLVAVYLGLLPHHSMVVATILLVMVLVIGNVLGVKNV